MILRRIGNEIHVATPAKLNLFLEVLSRRPDGYHDVQTVMVAIDRFDSVYCRASSTTDLEVECAWAPGLTSQPQGAAGSGYDVLPASADNLVAKALRKLRDQTGRREGICCRITKRIPSAAGLGGASSDAAAALLAANALWGSPLSVEELERFSGELGSDIPFFVRGSRAAVARGRGEQVEACACPAMLHVVVVRPPEGLSTAAVYQRCKPAEVPMSAEPLLQAMASGDVVAMGRSLFNRLQEPARQLSPWIERLQQIFAGLDCLGHQMSGSGSSYFGLFRNRSMALRASQFVRGRQAGAVFHATAAMGFESSGERTS